MAILSSRRCEARVALVALLALLLGPLLVAQPDARAANGVHTVFFPWVSHSEMIGGQGPWTGEFSVQNLGDQPCAVPVYVATSDGWVQRAQLSVAPRSTRHHSSFLLGISQPGAPVQFRAFCEISVALKQTTPRVATPPWSDGAHVVTGYSGLNDADITASRATPTTLWYLPIVQTNSDWNTLIRVANFSEASAIVATVELYPAGNGDGAAGADVIRSRQLLVAESWTIDALQEVGSDWVGFARITVTGEAGVIAQRVKPSASLAITNVAIAADSQTPSGTFRTLAPLLFNAYNGWNTGISLANTTDELAFVTIRYYEVDGEQVGEEQMVIPGRSMSFVYTPGNVPIDGFVGSAMIVSSVPLATAVDEVKYETVEALSYMGSSVPQVDAAIPVVFRENPGAGRHDNSGISIASFKEDGPQTVTVTLLSTSGQQVGDSPHEVVVPPSGNTVLYLPFMEDVPPGTIASVRLTSEDPAGFVAITNDINYASFGDGSVAFVASNSDGYYHVPPPPAPPTP
ncbi:MAG TPA: hypothetical protein VMM78_17570 [Thermomicrobiales bacterium]|nr:hypothetical protein [Thermomicrobiales bacterium]